MRLLTNVYLIFLIKRGQIGARLVNNKQLNNENVTTKISCHCHLCQIFLKREKKEDPNFLLTQIQVSVYVRNSSVSDFFVCLSGRKVESTCITKLLSPIFLKD